jgi:hypothetical protein
VNQEPFTSVHTVTREKLLLTTLMVPEFLKPLFCLKLWMKTEGFIQVAKLNTAHAGHESTDMSLLVTRDSATAAFWDGDQPGWLSTQVKEKAQKAAKLNHTELWGVSLSQ